MKKLDAFFITIVSLVLTLSGVFIYSYKSLDYFESNAVIKAKFERRKSLISLQKKLDEIAKPGKQNLRSVASITAEPDETEFLSEKNINNEKNMSVEESAEKYYLEAKVKCYKLNKESDCLRVIESAVTHFPESNWTGESLVLLTEFYYRTKRVALLRDILKILKNDFKNDESIQQKVVMIERYLL